MSRYQAQAQRDADGRWSAWIDDLPGCSAWGYTKREALAALTDAATAYVEDMAEAGEIPQPPEDVIILEPAATA